MTLRLRDGVSLVETDYGVVLLDEDSGQYWNLNPTGAQVLRTLSDGGTATRAAEQLTGHYAVDLDSATRDVCELLDGLRSAGLVTESPPPRAAPPDDLPAGRTAA